MNRDKEYDEVLRSRISEILDETIDESMDADDLYDFCAENGWIPISMKNDWLTVFGEGVTKNSRKKTNPPSRLRP